ncbi:hypothetical protein [Amycolatopsis sp. lyj-112]|uniref:hypothetical protein n=1 Tax=Amycolatopsis sp. lyj-112 TaxID=2789288 RepID=UPI00397DF5F6
MNAIIVGSGIFTFDFYPRSRRFVRALPDRESRKVFVSPPAVFRNRGSGPYSRRLAGTLGRRGFEGGRELFLSMSGALTAVEQSLRRMDFPASHR